jgi:hypothetical protein
MQIKRKMGGVKIYSILDKELNLVARGPGDARQTGPNQSMMDQEHLTILCGRFPVHRHARVDRAADSPDGPHPLYLQAVAGGIFYFVNFKEYVQVGDDFISG